MVSLAVEENLVFLDTTKEENLNYGYFVEQFLTKYEEELRVDVYRSTKKKKKFKSVQTRRELFTEKVLDGKPVIVFPIGLLSVIPKEEYKIINSEKPSWVISPDPTDEEIIKSLDCFDLRQDQKIAVRKCLVCKRGVIQLPTATGKSAIIASTVKHLLEANKDNSVRDFKVLVLAPTISTVENIKDTFTENGLDAVTVKNPSKYKPKKSHVQPPIMCALPQTLIRREEDLKEDLEDVGAVFYDECLPASAKILLADGTSRPVSEIYDDPTCTSVLSYNLETNEYEEKKILCKFKTPFDDKFCRVYYMHPTEDNVCGLSCTANHKIYTKERGYVEASKLTNKDSVLVDIPNVRNVDLFKGKCFGKVVYVRFNVGKAAKYKYNIEVEDNHNYFTERVLVSNCHHLQCDTWNRLNTLLPNAEYSLGFSALSIDKEEIGITDIRQLSYTAALIIGSSGRVLMHMDPSYYIEKGIIALPVLFRVRHDVALPEGFDESDWIKLAKAGLMSKERADKVAMLAAMFSKYGRKVLILVSEKEYAFLLGDLLAKKYDTCDFGISFGSGIGYLCNPTDPSFDTKTAYKPVNSLDVLDSLQGDTNIVIATSHTDEGVDIKGLDVCILAGSGKKDRRVIQRVGRVLRKSKHGKYAYVVDFTDDGSHILHKQSNERLSIYKEDIGIPLDNISNGVDVNDVEGKFIRLEGIEKIENA